LNDVTQEKTRRAFQLILVLLLIVTLIGFALNKLVAYQAELEPIRVEEVVDQLHQGLTRLKAEYWLQHNEAGLARFDKANPVSVLSVAPDSYLGELAGGDARSVKAGSWYFDLDRRFLVYRLKNPEQFDVPEAEIAYQISFSFADTDQNGRFDADKDKVLGLELVPGH